MKIGVFLTNFPLYFSVHIIELVNYLAGSGHEVDLFLQSSGEKVPKFFSPVSVIQLPDELRFGSEPLSNTSSSFLSLIPHRNQNLIRQFSMLRRYDYCLGIESVGLCLAKLAADVSGGKYGMMSLELYDDKNPGVWGGAIRQIKAIERALIKDADLLIIPDQERLNVYQEQLGLTLRQEQVRLIPIGLSESVIDRQAPDYWRSTLGIPGHAKVILYVGQLGPRRFNEEMVTGFQNVRDDAVLAFRAGMVGDGNYLKTLTQLDKTGRFILDIEELPWHRRFERIKGADIGLVFYTDKVINDMLTGRSSDKVAAYMQAAVPMVCPKYDTFVDVIKRYHNGVAISDFSELSGAVETILNKQEHFKQGAMAAYDELYNLDKHNLF